MREGHALQLKFADTPGSAADRNRQERMEQNPMNRTRTRNTLAILLCIMTALLSGCGPSDEQPQGKAIKGQPAPNFMLTDLTGKEWQLSDLRGKVVFINFWATWCPPCIQELPSMEALNQRLSAASFQMLTILYSDRPELGQSMVNKSGYSFPVLIDPDAAVGRQYGLTGVPETFIVDPQGILREKFIGPFDWDSQDAMKMLEKYLPQ